MGTNQWKVIGRVAYTIFVGLLIYILVQLGFWGYILALLVAIDYLADVRELAMTGKIRRTRDDL